MLLLLLVLPLLLLLLLLLAMVMVVVMLLLLTFLYFKKMSFLSGCQPFAVQCVTPTDEEWRTIPRRAARWRRRAA